MIVMLIEDFVEKGQGVKCHLEAANKQFVNKLKIISFL